MAIPLIGQLAKNYANGVDALISGDALLRLECNIVQEAQRMIGGKMVYLECENSSGLKNFYKENGFVEFGNRELDADEIGLIKTKNLTQMIKYFHDEE